MKHTFNVLIALAALSPLVAFAPNPTRDIIDRQIDRVANGLGVYEQSHRMYRGWLTEGERHTRSYELTAGRRYTWIGACDVDCSDLDFELLDTYDRVVVSDHDPDDTPSMSWTPVYSGTYRVRVRMYRCDIEPCEFGLRTYRH